MIDCLLYHLDSIYVYQYVRISKHFLIVFLFDIPCEQLHQLSCALVNNRHVTLQTVCVVYFLLSTLPMICHPSYSFSLIFWRLLITGLVFCPKSVVVWMSLGLKSVSGNLEDIHLLEHCLLNVQFLKLWNPFALSDQQSITIYMFDIAWSTTNHCHYIIK